MSSKVFALRDLLPVENISLYELEDALSWGWVIS